MYNQNILIKVINKMSKVTDNLHTSEITQNVYVITKYWHPSQKFGCRTIGNNDSL